MAKFDIWVEGYAATGEGERCSAHCMARQVEGDNFTEACINHFDRNRIIPDPNFNADSLTHWGCLLFPSEAEARRSYG